MSRKKTKSYHETLHRRVLSHTVNAQGPPGVLRHPATLTGPKPKRCPTSPAKGHPLAPRTKIKSRIHSICKAAETKWWAMANINGGYGGRRGEEEDDNRAIICLTTNQCAMLKSHIYLCHASQSVLWPGRYDPMTCGA